jgi:hercynylcysteine S-oxide lyase
VRNSPPTISTPPKLDLKITRIANATTGVNSVFRSLPFKPNEKILYISPSIYAAVRKTLEFIVDYHREQNLSLLPVEVTYPISDIALVDLIRKKIQEQGKPHNIKIALIDSISSVPGVSIPYKQIAKMLKDEGILCMIDGAHSFGHETLDLKNSDGVNFLTSNLHKWGYVHRAVALLYVQKS